MNYGEIKSYQFSIKKKCFDKPVEHFQLVGEKQNLLKLATHNIIIIRKSRIKT